MRDSFHDDHLLDRVMQDRFPQMIMACRAMSPEAVRQYVAEMHPAIVREYRLARVRQAYPLTGASIAGLARL